MDLIIGAGVTGISYANFTTNNFLIIEKEKEVGGYCRTIKRNGFVWDYSGHFFHFQNPDVEKYVCKNIDPSLLLRVEKHTQIYYKGKYVDFPFQKNIHQLEKEELVDCLYDLFTPYKGEVSSFKEMVYANLGKSIAEKFLVPYNEKLYACDLNSLDMNAMGRFFPKANKEDIILNFKSHDNSSYNSHFTYPKTGAIEYVNSLLHNIDNTKVSVDEELIFIDTEKKIATTNRREIHYDRLISTIPLPVLLTKCGIDYPEGVFSCNKVLVFNLGFDSKGDDRINNWVYFPDKNLSFYRVGYYDNIFGTDRMSLYVELGFYKDAVIDVEKWFRRVLEDLKASGIVSTQKLVSKHHVIMDPAYVHITERSLQDVMDKKKKLATSDIYSIGRYGSWTYCSIEDGMVEAHDLCQTIQ